VSTIGFIGYVLSKKFGQRVGFWMSGLLGGIVSSTAVTIAAGRMAQRDPGRSHTALQAALLAGSVMYLRILVIVAIVSPGLVWLVWWKFVALACVGVLLSLRVGSDHADQPGGDVPALENPFEVTPALWFAALFVLLTMVVTVVKGYVGTAGLYGLSALVGVTDIDPFILSLITGTGNTVDVVVAGILIAMMSNVVARGIYFGVLVGGLRKETAMRYALWAALHVPLILLS